MATNLFSSLLTLIAFGLGVWCLHRRRDLQVALVGQTYGILTRFGGERRWKHMSSRHEAFEVVFLDVDDMHRMNIELGYMGVERRLRGVPNLGQEDIAMARWYSGDEIIANVRKGDGAGFTQRLLHNMQAQQLSATFGVVPAQPELADAVKCAMEMVAAAKADGRRGTLCAPETASGRRAPSHAAPTAYARIPRSKNNPHAATPGATTETDQTL